jgi:hypothetical protein
VLFKEREHSTGRVVRADSVVQKRPDASCRIRVCGVGKKRPSTDSRVEVAGEVALE